MKQFSKSIVSVALFTTSTIAFAADAPVSFSANVAMTTDYVWRGISQTMEDPAIQGGFDVEHESGVYAGIWGSNVKFGEDGDLDADDGASVEIDLYAGYAIELESGLGIDLGYLYYMYPGADKDDDLDFGEFGLGLSYSMISLNYAYANDVGGESTHYVSLGLDYELPYDMSISASVGRYDWESEGSDYTDWMLSVTKSYGGFDFSLAYTDTDIDDNELSDARAIFTLAKSF